MGKLQRTLKPKESEKTDTWGKRKFLKEALVIRGGKMFGKKTPTIYEC